MVGWLKRLFFQQQEEPVAVTGIKVGDGNVELTVRTNLRKLYNVKVSKGIHDEYVLDTDCYDIVGIAEFVWALPVAEILETDLAIQNIGKGLDYEKKKMNKHVSRNKKPDPEYVQKYQAKIKKLKEDWRRLEQRFCELYHEIVEEGNRKHTEWDTTERQKR